MTSTVNSISINALRSATAEIDDANGFQKNVLGAAERLNKLNPSGNGSHYFERSEFKEVPQSTFEAGRALLLTEGEQAGAVTLYQLMAPIELTPTVAPVCPLPTVTIPARRTSITVAEIEADINQGRLPRGHKMHRVGDFDPFTRELFRTGYVSNYLSSYLEVAKRIAGTLSGSADGDPNDIKPNMLKAKAIAYDPYPNDGVYPQLATWMTAAEQVAALDLYDFYFNPKPQIQAPASFETPIMTLAANGASPVTISVRSVPESVLQAGYVGPVTSSNQDTLIFRGAPGTAILFQPSVTSSVDFSQQLIIGEEGEATLPTSGLSGGITGVVLQDPDGVGVLSPKIAGNFAFTIPGPSYAYGPDAHTIDNKGVLHPIDRDGNPI